MPLQRLFHRISYYRPTSQLNKRMMASSQNDTIIAKEFDDKGVLILNRPKALNAINLEMVKNIIHNLKKWEHTKQLVIVKSTGGKSFCAGGDVRSVVESTVEEAKEFFRHEYTMNAIIGNYKIPYIAFIDGITMGGGVGLSVHGKYRIATEKTLFAMPETAIGLFPDVGGSYFLPRLDGKLGRFLGLSGFRLKGEDVLKIGVATHYCESSKLPELEDELLKSKNSSEIQKIIEKFNNPSNMKSDLDKNLNNINTVFDASSVEEIFKNLENHKSEWAAEILKTLKKMSPTSLKVTFEQIERGSKKQSLIECLKMEYGLVVRHLENSDFKEGVRALLIDKDQKPIWNPPTLEQVTKERVQSFFDPLPSNEQLKLDNYADIETNSMTKSKL